MDNLNKTFLKKGNNALRCGNIVDSIRFYAKALIQNPEMGSHILENLALAKKRYRNSRNGNVMQDVAVSCWELAHNTAGRAYTLAMLYEKFSKVEIIGTIFTRFGCKIWEPIKDTHINKRCIVVEDEKKFIKDAFELVIENPYDIVHLSKPRAPNIFIGTLYKLVWGSKVYIDIDDEELAFVGSDTSIKLEQFLDGGYEWPAICDLDGRTWTRIAVGMVKYFDGITVSNIALQQRYGGEVIRHARDGKNYSFTYEQKKNIKAKFRIKENKKIIIFCGTPRAHKGLIETANAISHINQNNITFLIVGTFSDQFLKDRLLTIPNVEYCFVENQPFDLIPELLSIGDICVLFQDTKSQISRFQVPAKLTDALAIGLPVLVTDNYSLSDFFASGSVIKVNNFNLAKSIEKLIDSEIISTQIKMRGRKYFEEELELDVNSDRLRNFIDKCESSVESEFLSLFFDFIIKNFYSVK